jgi:hypothetical protein
LTILSGAQKEACKVYDCCQNLEDLVCGKLVVQMLTALNDFALVDALLIPLSGNYTMFAIELFVLAGGDYHACGKYSYNSKAGLQNL